MCCSEGLISDRLQTLALWCVCVCVCNMHMHVSHSLSLSLYVCMYVCMYVCIHVCICILTVYMFMFIQINIRTPILFNASSRTSFATYIVPTSFYN